MVTQNIFQEVLGSLITGSFIMLIGALIWTLKYFARTLSVDMKEHTKAAIKQVDTNKKLIKATEANTESSEQMIQFMTNLNGKLRKATIDTLRENKEVIREVKK